MSTSSTLLRSRRRKADIPGGFHATLRLQRHRGAGAPLWEGREKPEQSMAGVFSVPIHESIPAWQPAAILLMDDIAGERRVLPDDSDFRRGGRRSNACPQTKPSCQTSGPLPSLPEKKTLRSRTDVEAREEHRRIRHSDRRTLSAARAQR
jgi:hypothetical protein